MADILDFEEAKFHRDTGKLLWGEHDVNIDWQDVTVYGATGEPQMTDAISMGEKTRQKVAKLFASFGLPAKPNTYGELLRNVEYCEILILITGGPSAGVSLDCMMGSGDIWKPGWGARIKAIVEGALEPLARLHQEADVFRLNGLRADNKRSSCV